MPKPGVDTIVTQQMRRLFFQSGGPRPGNTVAFAGLDAQYMILDGVKRPLRKIDPIKIYDPRFAKRFRNVGRKISAPDFATATLHILENRGTLPFQLGDLSCAFNLYLPVGLCDDLSDFLAGWTDFVEIVSFAEATEVDEGARTAWADDNQSEDAVSITIEGKYGIGSLSFSAAGASLINREVIDVVYGGGIQCGDCGPSDDGSQRIYAVVKASGVASPGLPAELVYSLDGGHTVRAVGIDNMGTNENPVAVDIVGGKLVIIGSGAYFWANLSRLGVPGTFTKVSTGFVTGGEPNDLFVLGTQEVFFVGNGGYVYKSTDITAGVTAVDAGNTTTSNLLRVHGDSNVLVAVGQASTVIVSTNRGNNWGTVLAAPSAIPLDLLSVAVKEDEVWLVGSGNSGRLYYTLDGGASWVESQFTGTGAGNVRDIVFATDEVGWFVHDDNTPTGRIWATWNGGASWVRNDGGSARMLNWPTLNRINRIAVPDSTRQVSANNVLLGGVAGDGTDGILLLGTPNEV